MRWIALTVLLFGCAPPLLPEIAWGEPDPPAIAWLDRGEPEVAAPVLTPCPAGWREEPRDGVAVCVAYETLARCPDPTAIHVPGEPGCRPVGDPCTADGLPDPATIPAGAIHVLAEAAPGGDGTRERPFTTLRDALAATPDGGTLVVGRGRYDEAMIVRRSMAIVGTCPAESVLAPQVGGDGAIMVTDGAEVSVRSLGFDGLRGGVAGYGEATIDVSGIVCASPLGTAVWLDGPGVRGRVEDLVVRDAADENRGLAGAVVLHGAQLELSRASLEDVTGAAIYASDPGSRAVVSDVLVARTAVVELAQGVTGAITADPGSEVRLARVWMVDVAAYAVAAYGGALTVEDLVVEGARAISTGEMGFGIHGNVGGTVVARRVRIEGAESSAVAMRGIGSSLLVEDALLRPGIETGRGGVASDQAHVSLRRVAVQGAAEIGLAALSGAALDAEDLRISDVAPLEGERGRGVECSGGSSCELARATVERVSDAAIAIADPSTALTLADVCLRGVRDGSAARGAGVRALHGAGATISRVLIDGAHGYGLLTASRPLPDEEGVPDAHVAIEDLVARRISPCAEPGCDPGLLGTGFAALDGSDVEITRALLEDVEHVGYLQSAGRARVAHVRVRRARVGIAIGTSVALETQAIATEDVATPQTGVADDAP